MIPHTIAQWCWLAFFVIGTIGGWIFIGGLIWMLRGTHRKDSK